MKLIKKLVSLLLIVILHTSNVKGQAAKDTTLESAIGTFIHYPEIAEWLRRDLVFKNDSTLYFVDLSHTIKIPFVHSWMGCAIRAITDTLLLDSLHRFYPHSVINKGRSEYYVLFAKKISPENTDVMVLHPFNNLLANATITRTGKYYIITKTSRSVL